MKIVRVETIPLKIPFEGGRGQAAGWGGRHWGGGSNAGWCASRPRTVSSAGRRLQLPLPTRRSRRRRDLVAPSRRQRCPRYRRAPATDAEGASANLFGRYDAASPSFALSGLGHRALDPSPRSGAGKPLVSLWSPGADGDRRLCRLFRLHDPDVFAMQTREALAEASCIKPARDA